MHIFSEQIKKDHILLNVDSRIKLLMALSLLCMVLSNKGIVFSMVITLICILTCILIKVPFRTFILRFSEPLFIVSVIVFLKFFFSGKDVLFSISIPFSDLSLITLKGYKDGFMDGLSIACRIIGSVSIVALLSFSTPFLEIISALSWLKVPKGVLEILVFAYRYIFVLFEDAMVIYNAQKNRLGYSNIRRGLSSFGILTGSLILKAFEQSQNITQSMIQRGYDGKITMLRHRSFRFSEVFVSILLIIVMGFIWKI